MNKIYSLLRNYYVLLRDKYLYLRRLPYLMQIKKILDKDTSIISSNCFAGRVMQDLGMQYNTPTLGLWFMPDDFPKFCSNLSFYLNAEIVSLEHSKNDLGEWKRTHPRKHPYPVGKLGDNIEIHFLHYYTEEEAFNKFRRRSQRVNMDKIILIAFEQNGCTENDVKAFNDLPSKNKLFFCSTPYNYECVVYIKEFSKLGHVGDPYKKGHIYYKYFLNWLKEHI